MSLTRSSLIVFASAAAALAQTPGASTGIGFRGLEIYRVEGSAARLRLVDWNLDGLTDIAVVNNSRATIDFFIQKTEAEMVTGEKKPVEFDKVNEIASDARFRKETFLTEKRVFDLLVDDLNGDKVPDLAFYGDPKELVVVFRAPLGGKETRQRFSIDEARAFGRGLGAGDLNGDGRTDLVLLGTGNTHLFFGSEEGKLAESIDVPSGEKNNTAIVVADLDGDGRKDLFLAGAGAVDPIRVRLQGPSGLGPEVSLETPAFRSALVTDLTGDGRAEIALVQGTTGRLVVFQLETVPPEGKVPLGRIRIHALPPGEDSGKQPLAFGDVDGDGLIDVLETSASTAQLRLHRQVRGGEILAPVSFPTLAGAGSTRIGDVDGDGKPEVVLLSADEKSLGVSRWDGARLTFPQSLPLKAKPLSCDLADLDGKPGAEIAVALDQDGESAIQIFALGEPVESLGEPLEIKDAKDPPEKIRFVDADQDGQPDLAVFFPYEALRIYLRGPGLESGRPSFSDVSGEKDFGRGLLQGAVLGSFTTGDLNADGKAELLLSKKNFARAFRVNAKRKLEVADQFNARDSGAEIVGVAVGDFVGDGKPEVVLLDKTRNQLIVLARNDMGTHAAVGEVKVPAFSYRGLSAVDMNGDGRVDLVVEGDDRFGVLLSGGTEVRLKRVAEYETDIKDGWLDTIAAGDVNSDGVPELILSELREHLIEFLSQGPRENPSLRREARFKVFEDSSVRGEGAGEKTAREPREIQIGDVTGDRKSDVVILIHDRIIVYPQE